MKCEKCKNNAVFSHPNYCKEHFIPYFENKVESTIERFHMLDKKDKIVVACSGGKDSLSTLYLMKKFHGNVTALAIDEGIHGYRSKTLEDLKNFCNKHNIVYKIVSFKDEVGKTLDELMKTKQHPCTVCGMLRRNLLNKHAKGFTKIATGHNMDDESQAVIMNLFKNQTFLMQSLGPVSKKNDLFIPRIKPLYFCSEKEVATYALLMGFQIHFTECPNIAHSYRSEVRDALNQYAQDHKETKRNILESFLNLKEHINIPFKERNMEKFAETIS